MSEALERFQVGVYVGAILAGAALGRLLPGAGEALEPVVNPVLAALLYVTFLQVPAAELIRATRNGRFVAAALAVNFVAVPLLVAAMVPFLPDEPAVRAGVLLVLLCPCVDYVIVFSGLAGADNRQLLATTPLLLVVQLAVLPLFLLLFLGPDLDGAGGASSASGQGLIRPAPFLTAFVTLIAAPLALAWLTQAWTARSPVTKLTDAISSTMVPLMALTLFTVVASQVPKLDEAGPVLRVVPFYVVFLAVMPFAGLAVARAFRLPPASARAILFTGATRNSLVVLPLAMSLPGALGTTAAATVVTQTLVEIVGMLIYLRIAARTDAPPAHQAPTWPG